MSIMISIYDSHLEEKSSFLQSYLDKIGEQYQISFNCSSDFTIYNSITDNSSLVFLHIGNFPATKINIQSQTLEKRHLVWTSSGKPEFKKITGKNFSVECIENIRNYIDYKNLNWPEALEEWHCQIENSNTETVPEFPIAILTKPKETDYLTALILLYQGYLTAQILNDKKLLAKKEIVKATENIGMKVVLKQDYMKNLTVDIKNVNDKSYWTDVFQDAQVCEEKLKKEWKGLTNLPFPESVDDFIGYLKGTVIDINVQKIALMYNEMHRELKNKL